MNPRLQGLVNMANVTIRQVVAELGGESAALHITDNLSVQLFPPSMGDFARIAHADMGEVEVNYQAEELKLVVRPHKDHRDPAPASYLFKAKDLRSGAVYLSGFPANTKIREAFEHVVKTLPERLEVDSVVFDTCGDWHFYNRQGSLLDFGHSKVKVDLLREAADDISDHWPAVYYRKW